MAPLVSPRMDKSIETRVLLLTYNYDNTLDTLFPQKKLTAIRLVTSKFKCKLKKTTNVLSVYFSSLKY